MLSLERLLGQPASNSSICCMRPVQFKTKHATLHNVEPVRM